MAAGFLLVRGCQKQKSQESYNRTHEQTISEDAIIDKLVGKKQKRIEIIDVIVDKDKAESEE